MSEVKTSKPDTVQGKGTFEGQQGTMYKWDVTFENGDSGLAFTQKAEQEVWVVGKEVKYTIEQKQGRSGPWNKLTKFKDNSYGGNRSNRFYESERDYKKRQMAIIYQSSLHNAIEFHNNFGFAHSEKQGIKANRDEVIDTMDFFANAIFDKCKTKE